MTTSVASSLRDVLERQGYLLADGAMGTQLFELGLQSGDAPELWNIDHPDRVRAVHQRYLDAGSDIVLTNSFGGTRFRLALHGLQDRVVELNSAAARVARSAVDALGRPAFVAGSMGPSGELLEPMGTMTVAGCEAAFAEQALGLAGGGADILWIETMSSLEEAAAAVRGARSVSDLPVVVTMSFDTAGRTMMGVTGEQLVNGLVGLGLMAIGANCGNNLADTEAAALAMHTAQPDLLIVSKANAGIPRWADGGLQYDGSPEIMAAHAHRLRSAGISIIGACCGSGPSHLAKMAAVLRGDEAVPDVAVGAATVAADPSTARGGRRRRR
jgi:5-methyltetrahydrofolate--homocysteine methyltransferase